MKITKHAQSCTLIETNNTKILIDPGSFVFNEEGIKPEEFNNIKLILITHEHSDHFDWENIQKIIELNNCQIIGTNTLINIVKEKYPNANWVKVINNGGEYCLDNIKINAFLSKHGPLPNGKAAPAVMGYVINDGNTSFYTPGDTTYLNPDACADIIATPICGQVVMDIETAKLELLKKKPKITIPIHYDNPKYPVDVNDFIKAMEDTNIETKTLNWGKSVEV